MPKPQTPAQLDAERKQIALAFVDEFAKFLPPEKREELAATAKATIEADPKAAAYIHETYLRRQEGSRLYNATQERERTLAAQERLLNDWWKKNERAAYIGGAADAAGLVDEHGQLRTNVRPVNGGTPPADDEDDFSSTPSRRPTMPASSTSDALTRAQFEEQVRSTEAQVVRFTSDINQLQARHGREFNEVLDTDALIQYAHEVGLPLRTAYDSFVGERREERRKQEQEQALDAAKKEAYEEGRRSVLVAPYPSPTSANSTLSNINKPFDAGQFGVETAARELQTLIDKNGASGL